MAMPEMPANTPKPIGSTSSFFPGGSKVAAAPAFSALGVGWGDEDDGPDERGKANGEDRGGVSVDVPMLSGSGVGTGFGAEERP